MIRIFNKIRQKQLGADISRSYLIYAVGEFILVVIGILVALQIDNWNEVRKAKHLELQLYQKILIDLESEYQSILGDINSAKFYQDLNYHIYNETKGRAQYDPNQPYHYLQFVHIYHLSLKEKHAESLAGIKDDQIRELLKDYISTEEAAIGAIEEWNEYKVQYLRPFFSKLGIHNTEAVFNDRPYTFDALMTADLIEYDKLSEQYGTIELDEILFELRFKTSWMYHTARWLEKVNIELKMVLEDKLDLPSQYERADFKALKKLSGLLADGKPIDEIIDLLMDKSKNETIYDLTENGINEFGYLLMKKEKNHEALKIFKLNTEFYPDAFNTYDSFGECLLLLGDTMQALKSYKRSLEINPNNKNAKNVLANLE